MLTCSLLYIYAVFFFLCILLECVLAALNNSSSARIGFHQTCFRIDLRLCLIETGQLSGRMFFSLGTNGGTEAH